MATITQAKGGTAERQVDVATLQVPDLWHIAIALKQGKADNLTPAAGDVVLNCWSLCHDLLKHIRES